MDARCQMVCDNVAYIAISKQVCREEENRNNHYRMKSCVFPRFPIFLRLSYFQTDQIREQRERAYFLFCEKNLYYFFLHAINSKEIL